MVIANSMVKMLKLSTFKKVDWIEVLVFTMLILITLVFVKLLIKGSV
ncbi:MAG: hypothetical protein QF915_03465 [Candidatus Woesearchaeota archaeon]|nr:hypothetical protein [Candidatus Woesearchaeota archaeon]